MESIQPIDPNKLQPDVLNALAVRGIDLARAARLINRGEYKVAENLLNRSADFYEKVKPLLPPGLEGEEAQILANQIALDVFNSLSSEVQGNLDYQNRRPPIR
jgi:hypothetical protein